MALADKITDLKRQGIPDSEIEIKLRNEGISPMEISDAMNQSKIKEAVEGEGGYSTKGMTPSMMGDEEQEAASEDEEVYSPAPAYNPAPAPSPTGGYSGYSYQEETGSYPQYDMGNGEEYYQEGYNNSGGAYDASGYSMNPETMIEVAEQVFSEKMKKIEDDLKSLKEFKTIYMPKIDDLNERLKRIERNFDKMQIAILDRIGSFGRSIDSVKKEVEMVEDSFEKINRTKSPSQKQA
jgi:hypothetical protein